MNQSGILAPGRSAGSTTVTGDYTQLTAGILQIEIGGVAQGTQYDVLNVTSDAVLGGQLDLKLIGAFVPTASQNFIIMSANTVTGGFSNAANDQRLTTADGDGSFLVHYGPGSAFDPALSCLADFNPVVFPATSTETATSTVRTYSAGSAEDRPTPTAALISQTGGRTSVPAQLQPQEPAFRNRAPNCWPVR